MRSSFPLGRVLGIPIRVHLSWFPIAGLIAAALAFNFAVVVALPVAIVAGVLAACALFASVLLHELGHCVFARAFGIHVRQIQLFLFGGVAEILGDPRRVREELVIALAGPAVSLALAAGFAPIAFSIDAPLARAFLMFLFLANALLFAFNMIPAFPTDGGRVLRAILWGALGDYARATRWAAAAGTALALFLVGAGLMTAIEGLGARDASDVVGPRVGGVWMAMIGLYLARSAKAGVEQARISARLRAGTAGEVMLPVSALVPPDRSLLQVLSDVGGPSAADMLLGFPVGTGGVCIGYVEPDRLFEVPRDEWGAVHADEVMTPLDAMPRVAAGDPLDVLVRDMVETGGAGALVFEGGSLVGYVGRADVARFVMATAARAAA